MNAAGEERTALADEGPPGELLRRERERRGLSLQQAAEDLHLDAWIVEALESNRFSALGAPVYARGYLRQYATLLGLSPDVVIARYEAAGDLPSTPTPIPTSLNVSARTERISLEKPLAIVVGLVIAAAIVWGALRYLDGAGDTPGTASMADQTQPQGAPPSAEEGIREPDAAADSLYARASDETLAEPATAPENPPAVAAPDVSTEPESRAATPAQGQHGAVSLRLEFSGASWVEVYDGEDRRLMYGLGEPGRARTLVGTPPLKVTLGAASAVTAHVNGQPIVIPRRAGRDASRFSIDAEGEVTPGGV